MIRLMARFPVIVMFGAGLIGWFGGETIASDVELKDVLVAQPWLHYGAAVAGAALVLGLGRALQLRQSRRDAAGA